MAFANAPSPPRRATPRAQHGDGGRYLRPRAPPPPDGRLGSASGRGPAARRCSRRVPRASAPESHSIPSASSESPALSPLNPSARAVRGAPGHRFVRARGSRRSATKVRDSRAGRVRARRRRPVSPPRRRDWSPRNLFLPLTSPFVGGPGYWYDERELRIDTTPSGAIVDLFYIRSNFQKRYEQAETPVTVILPSRLASLRPRRASHPRARAGPRAAQRHDQGAHARVGGRPRPRPAAERARGRRASLRSPGAARRRS